MPRSTFSDVFKDPTWYMAVCLQFMGLCLLPLTCARLGQLVRQRSLWTPRQWMALPWVCTALFICTGRFLGAKGLWIWPMPNLGNILYDFGVGPLLLRDIAVLKLPLVAPVHIGGWWWLITFLSLLSVSVALVDLSPRPPWRAQNAGSASWLFLVLWSALVLITPYHLLSRSLFDRYLLPALPPLAVLCVQKLGPRPPSPAWIAVTLFLVFSLAGLQDYMAWNRARWQGIGYLRTELKAQPEQIDGGYEFNGLFTREESQRRTGSTSFYDQGPFGMWVLDDKYAVSFQPRPGCVERARVPYFSWLGLRTRYILVLERAR